MPPLAALMLAAVLPASAPIPPTGGRASFTLEPGQARRHEIALEAGQFLQATVHQQGLDVALRLLGPDGAEIEKRFDQSEGPVGMEPASLPATVAGVYAIVVEAGDDADKPGAYEIENQPPRAPSERDRLRREAERLMQRGSRHMGPRAAASRPRPQAEDAPALDAYRQAVPLWEQLGETCWQAEALSCSALAQTWSGQRETIESHVRALDLWQACGDDGYKFAETVLFTGRALARWSQLREAAGVLELGLLLAPPDDRALNAQFLVQLSSVHSQLGDTGRAIATGEQALALLRGWHLQGTAVVLTNLANAHYRRGSLQKASGYALEALAVRREVGEELGLVTSLATLSEIYQGLGEPEQALGYLNEALAVTVASGGPAASDLAFNATVQASKAVRSLRQPGAGRRRLEQALASPQAMEPRSLSKARLDLATLLLDDGETARALAHVEDVLDAAERIEDPLLQADAFDLRARIALGEGDLPAAETAAALSLARRRAVGDRVGEAVALLHAAQARRAAGDLEAARAGLESARAVVEAQRTVLVSPHLRATWTGTVREIDEAYVDVLMDLHARDPERGRDVLAFEAAEAASARSLLDVLGGGEEPAPGSAGDRELSARERLANALDRQMRARAASAPADELLARAQEVRDLSAEHQRMWAEARAGDPRLDAHEPPVPLRLAEIRARVLDDESTLLLYFLGPQRGYAWAVSRDGFHSHVLPPRAQIDAAEAAVARGLAQPPQRRGTEDAAAALRALASLVLPEDAAILRGRRLVVVADGSLHHVPFAALPDASGRPLVERLEIANVPSASVVAQLRRETALRAPASRSIVVLADPVYDASDPRLPAASRTGLQDPVLARATRGFGFQDGRLPRLPFTRREARGIAALAPDRSRALLDFSANLDAVRAADLSSYRYVHFATHGLLNDDRPELSGLVLSLVDREGRPRTGLLTAPDVSSLRLRAELVVLSSCRSAAGREVRGEGLLGLTRAFMHAGAPRVLASLWPIDDLASSELMTRTYAGMLGPRTLAPAAALREAQLQMLRHRRWRAPYYWAAFQLQGEWR
ncbi:MAG: CHAT domain-containing tetratricopeptide repeat protein [Vicinamibacteria bacterium]